ncbi:hypothetical protein [Oligoflexus tunisiensis]|uniref:hypothetical protein n=1 Tax=Oligoflexus tunisiensis TaxID=708132 RepID=UPI00114CCFEA|nr:hypothetical protein [Oligoflexus tunisiensis]
MMTAAGKSLFTIASLVFAHSAMASSVAGYVTKVVGDCMPGSASCTTLPVETEVLVMKGKVKAPTNSASLAVENLLQSENLWARIKTDSQGHYSTDIEPGVYTLFAVFGDRAYLNLFTGAGDFWHVNIEDSKNLRFDIENTEEAYF